MLLLFEKQNLLIEFSRSFKEILKSVRIKVCELLKKKRRGRRDEEVMVWCVVSILTTYQKLKEMYILLKVAVTAWFLDFLSLYYSSMAFEGCLSFCSDTTI